MTKLVQYIKANNAFIRRDYLISVPVVLLLAMQAHMTVIRHLRAESVALNLFTFCFFAAIILLPAVYHRWALAVTTGFFVLLVISLAEGLWSPDWQNGLRLICAFLAFGELTVVLWARRIRQRPVPAEE